MALNALLSIFFPQCFINTVQFNSALNLAHRLNGEASHPCQMAHPVKKKKHQSYSPNPIRT